MSAFQTEPFISAGVMTGTGKVTRSGDSLAALAREAWPDLPEGAPLVVLPREDFDVILAATEGQRMLTTRNPVVSRVVPRQPPRNLDYKALFRSLAYLAIWAAFAISVFRVVTR